MRSPRRFTVGTLAALAVGTVVAATASAPASAAPTKPAAGCSTKVLSSPQRAQDVARTSPAAFTASAARNGRTEARLRDQARNDKSLWLDQCGQAFYTEEKAPTATQGATTTTASAPVTGTVPLSDTFLLESKPGSARTIYLDFLGGTVTNTAWNSQYGSTITVEPFSITAPADTAFTDAELTEIQRAWQVVAEDYAAFDVNVTTKDPGSAAIDRSSSTDNVYGTTVMITNGGPIYTSCGCGGIAYVNVFNLSGSNHLYYEPAWVFSSGTTTSGKNMGEAAAHEVGHNFGLSHDGTSTSGYYTGVAPWAPIMGAGYYQPITQWSKGEYPDANNTEDDLSIIATGAPLRADDYGDTAATAAQLTTSGPVNGVIGTRTDVDAFTFSAAGATTLTATPSPAFGDLDIKLTILDSSGATVATVDPTATKVNSAQATGMDATWSVTLPSTAATYTALVDGVGTGNPATAGLYSDYASIGNYQISLSTQATSTPQPLALSTSTVPTAFVNTAYSATPVTASGGTSPYVWSASGLPAGLVISSSTGTISGTPTTAGTYPVTVSVTDAAGGSASQAISMTVSYPAVVVANQSFAGKLGKPFSAQLKASGGNGSYSWSAVSLPAGYSLSSSGLLTGTPSKTGKVTFTATATSLGQSGSGSITVNVTRK